MLKRFLPLLMLAACSAAPHDDPPPQWIVGTYRYSGSGSVVKKFPWSAEADLVLDQNGQYTLSVTVHVQDEQGGDTDTDESYGSYYVRQDRLILEPAHKTSDVDEFDIRGDRLVPRMNWAAKLTLKGFKVPDPVFVKTE